MIEHESRLVLNMDALVPSDPLSANANCGELFCALARSERLQVAFVASHPNIKAAQDWLRQQGISGTVDAADQRPLSAHEIVLTDLVRSSDAWQPSTGALKACWIADLMAAPTADARPDAARVSMTVLDARTLVLAASERVKQRVLSERPDLSVAQVAVVDSDDGSPDVTLAEDALLDALRRHRLCPTSLLWQYPSPPADAALPASFLGFANGGRAPNFGLCPRLGDGGWPRWSDALVSDHDGRIEGGLRTEGVLKAGTSDGPLVSYVTVVRNNVATLGRAIDSVQRQTYRNVEHIVVDGASSDGTLDLIRRHAHHLDYFVSEPDRGLYEAINKAIPLARGQLICVLNSDDWLEPHAAEIAVHRMRGLTGGAAFLATGAVIYNLQGGVEVEWPPTFVHPGSYFACANVCHNGVYATRNAYERSGPYDATFRIAADFKWVMTCIDAGVEFVYTREVCVNYSLGGTSGDAHGHSAECQRVVAARFPFLERTEVLALYDCYFLFQHQPHETSALARESATDFLRRLMVKYAERIDFVSALAWAASTKLVHPLDIAPPMAVAESTVAPVDATAAPPAELRPARSFGRLTKDMIKVVLHRYPRLYDAARRGYTRLRG